MPPRGGGASAGDAAAAFLPVGMAVSMKTYLSQMMGVAEPLPGSFTFHLTLLVSLQLTGGLAAGATPLAKGPRHCGQFSSAPALAARAGRPAGSRTAAVKSKSGANGNFRGDAESECVFISSS